jgi:Fibronectin type III domain
VEVTSYKLWFDTLQTVPSYQLAYSGSSLSVVLDATTVGLATGTLYRFKVQAVNEFGDSDFSEDVKASLGSVPSKPHTPVKVEMKSSKTSIAVQWDQNDDSVSAKVTGYQLLMDDGYNGDFTVIYDGSGFPNTFSYTAQNLTTGLPYRFKVVALNINGKSMDGDSVTIYACLKPRDVLPPYKIETTKTTITVGWYEPDNMGCPILGFELYRDTGNQDAISI